jgi:hypothetical protein
VKRFAWFPIECENGIVVWLEHYTSDEKYCTYLSWELGVGAVEDGPAWVPVGARVL